MVLGITFIYRGIAEFNEPGIIVVFETSPHKLIRDAYGFGWNFEELQEQNKLQIIFTTPELLHEELHSPEGTLLRTAEKIGAQRIFIDGVSLLRNGKAQGDGTGNGSE